MVVRYGTTPYGTALYGGERVEEYVAEFFRAQAVGYGRVVIEWSRPTGAWTHQRLVRSLGGVPLDELDGETVFEEPNVGARLSYEDTGLVEGRTYYYGLFIRGVGPDTWLSVGTAEVLLTFDHDYTGRLYRQLPEVFRVSDYSSLMSLREDEHETLLYRFLSVFGLQLDHLRSELEGTRLFSDPRQVSGRLLPSMAHLLGLEYEPELGDRVMRRLSANAMRLWATKGTLAGTRALVTALTGWHTTVRIGHNVALDRLMAGPDGGVGQWAPGNSSTLVGYRAFTENDSPPAAVGGYLTLSRTSTTVNVLWAKACEWPIPTGRVRKQYSIPVRAGLAYLLSDYMRAPVTGVTGSVSLTWLNELGQFLGQDIGPGTALGVNTWTRVSHRLVAPAAARYLEVGIRSDGMPMDAEVHACGLQIEEEVDAPAEWRPAREVIVYLLGQLINYVGNTSGRGHTAYGWENAVSLVSPNNPTFFYLAFTRDVHQGSDQLALVDGITVSVPNEQVLPEPALASDPTPRIAVYSGDLRPVRSREVWSVLVDASSMYSVESTQVQAGFALYDGPDLIRYEWGPLVAVEDDWTTVGAELDVPDNADYDRIAFALRTTDYRVVWRSAALEPVRLVYARQFDGSTPSRTYDYLWEGVPYRSPSHYFARRALTAQRLRELLADYLPHPTQFRLVFAPSDIPDSPRASAGSDLDPDDAQTTTVGTRGRMRWRVAQLAGENIIETWAVHSNKVGRELVLRHHVDNLNALQPVAWNVQAHVAGHLRINLEEGHAVGAQLALTFDVHEAVALTDDLGTA